jgi:hypothetical protein
MDLIAGVSDLFYRYLDRDAFHDLSHSCFESALYIWLADFLFFLLFYFSDREVRSGSCSLPGKKMPSSGEAIGTGNVPRGTGGT